MSFPPPLPGPDASLDEVQRYQQYLLALDARRTGRPAPAAPPPPLPSPNAPLDEVARYQEYLLSLVGGRPQATARPAPPLDVASLASPDRWYLDPSSAASVPAAVPTGEPMPEPLQPLVPVQGPPAPQGGSFPPAMPSANPPSPTQPPPASLGKVDNWPAEAPRPAQPAVPGATLGPTLGQLPPAGQGIADSELNLARMAAPELFLRGVLGSGSRNNFLANSFADRYGSSLPYLARIQALATGQPDLDFGAFVRGLVGQVRTPGAGSPDYRAALLGAIERAQGGDELASEALAEIGPERLAQLVGVTSQMRGDLFSKARMALAQRAIEQEQSRALMEGDVTSDISGNHLRALAALLRGR